ncbi:GNAT family N-acetyltransferase [Georgenia sp. EYE_87]|uniref:GNAT family N-acetyltransferase n=1 Tax=Georgenia sp. EYE_87 TaxID=2853448 RepID=UPI002006CA9E|nr:GNAT family N-acetyltransferase [Georgenia sp. EYE_87]MCK6212636.1 GNAT family N-acetyltransferase [Georgenia sp. EYE_87]
MPSKLPSARIRPANVLDAPAIAAVHLRCWHETYDVKVPEDVYAERAAEGPGEWERALSDPNGPTTWLAQRDGEAVGFAQAVAPGAGHVRPLELRLLYVVAEEQGRRTGTHLLQLAIGDAPCQLWVEEGNTRAQGFYRHHGFELDGERRAVAAGGALTEVRMLR